MGRELQKRKRRSSRAKVTMPSRPKKALNPLGNDTIAQNWDKKETLSQNYSRFGLVAKLGTTAGGTNQRKKKSAAATSGAPGKTDPLVFQSGDQGLFQVSEVKVERDANGRITHVLREANPLRDRLNDFESDPENETEEKEHEEWGGIDEPMNENDRPAVIRQLEREANMPVETKARYQSERELEWLQSLVAKYGDDRGAMARDRKLNPMQQTAADITRRLKKAGLLKV
ncbi:ribosome biogenesis protein Nop16 [Lasiosphaeris hirsuta]|uniref:Nucleolar protein 16 n=1 Tax=Lasiosphaeris hirsuta TaxID=260670 RepID=A0AA40DXU3_9PEZI|nr:ribosome biogenesis protein Nop16 [Lasiosphaeris hirsuta]